MKKVLYVSRMQYIRDHYGVPAKRGLRIAFEGQPCVIVSARDVHLRVRDEKTGETYLIHPTWHVDYNPPEEA